MVQDSGMMKNNKSFTYLTEINASASASQDFLTTARKLLRGTGVKLRLNGRNPNRKQFYGNDRFFSRKYRQNLPIRLSTSIYINLTSSGSSSHPRCYGIFENKFDILTTKKMLNNLIDIYRKNGTNIFIN